MNGLIIVIYKTIIVPYIIHMENRQTYKLDRYIFLAVIIIFGIFLLMSVMQFFTAFLGAIMFYVLSKSSMERMLRRGWNKTAASVVVITLTFFIILLPIMVMATMLYKKIITVATNPQSVLQPVKHFDEIVQQKFHITLLSGDNVGKLQTFATDMLSMVLNSGFNLFSTILMMYFFLYFMLMKINRMEAAIVFYLPFKRSKIQLFGDELVAQTFSNAVGVPLIAVVHGLLAFAGYMITGLQEAGFWATLTGVASVLPIVGTGIVWVPAAIYLFATGHTWQGFFLLGWGAIVIGTSDNIIRFLLAKKMADVHPIVTVLGIIIGLKYFGITGLIFGPLLISYFLILLKIYYMEYQKPMVQKRTLLPSYFQIMSFNTPSPTKNKKTTKP